jgi:hypothetical protein
MAQFVGKRAVENAAPRKSPKAGLSHCAWKSRNRQRDFHFFHRPGYDGLTFRFHSDKKEEKKKNS